MADVVLVKGTPVAQEITESVKRRIEAVLAADSGANAATETASTSTHGRRHPGLATIAVGDEDGARTYVGMKTKACASCGIEAFPVLLPEATTQQELLQAINTLNSDERVDGILLQLPLPRHLDEFAAVEAISPKKDVDGLTTTSAGLMAVGREDGFITCTPAGILVLLEKGGCTLKGANAVIINRSPLLGRPLSMLLLNKGATVTVCHEETPDLGLHTLTADIIITAVSKPGLITGSMVKEGVVVIDGGYSRVNGKVCGDVSMEQVQPKARRYTPAVGGVGPLTIAMLLQNTLKAWERNLPQNH
ncbi:tetrahydrofolate dehydrogenase/cyclohydrolase [Pelomyxa schiedti]|nr:tetrahydrofolate dehydrogenase/cyclohydrolase [Pelomyxa schiedti]